MGVDIYDPHCFNIWKAAQLHVVDDTWDVAAVALKTLV